MTLTIGNRSRFAMLKVHRSGRFAISRPIPTMLCLHMGPVYVALWKQGER